MSIPGEQFKLYLIIALSLSVVGLTSCHSRDSVRSRSSLDRDLYSTGLGKQQQSPNQLSPKRRQYYLDGTELDNIGSNKSKTIQDREKERLLNIAARQDYLLCQDEPDLSTCLYYRRQQRLNSNQFDRYDLEQKNYLSQQDLEQKKYLYQSDIEQQSLANPSREARQSSSQLATQLNREQQSLNQQRREQQQSLNQLRTEQQQSLNQQRREQQQSLNQLLREQERSSGQPVITPDRNRR